MDMRNFILHRDILSVEAKINESDYIFGVQWKAPEKPYDETWVLKSYANKLTGEKDLSQEKINGFLDAINAKWNWNVAQFKK
ncbi:hypothetical protein CFK37_19500 [Virgibacillus phasianinus]|uniref:Uncharacterized protein n=1 Tax=Virgibacillus phasianinus TaxID=2017483 RepID=A0A220U7S6_9BACI|nr:hypothetical protein [Virgibacillus phasianinus]ASK64177.1 hypothetical protein CFK37_19500 [Virgibacillus phasianinus]